MKFVPFNMVSNSVGMYKHRFSANNNKMKILFLQLDSKLNQPDEKGCLTLDLALSTGQKDLALNLIEHKVQIDQLDSKGFTPLHNAIIRGIEKLSGTA